MATVVSGSQALRLGSIRIGEEFDPSSVYSSGTSAYFLLPNGYSELSGAAFSENGPGVVPTLGTVTGWAKYGYDGTEHFSFSGLNMSVEDWAAAVEENDTTGLLTAALSEGDDITGGALADELFGFAGNDTIEGDAGNDTLRGDAGNDDLDGGLGADAMTGGDGDDIYKVDNVGDRVTEATGEGNDLVLSWVTHSLADHVERLSLMGDTAINGTGNGENNILNGNTAANILNGGAGVDTMAGGPGNDTYVVDRLGETVAETADEGTDTVQSAVSFVLGNNVDNLTLTGTAVSNGTGNALPNTLIGNAAANTLDGRAGLDAMAGGAGNDLYIVDDVGDRVTEAANAGTDTVHSAVEFTLGANVENLTLTGAGDINGTGNTLGNILIGNTGVNTLNGGGGADRMFGGGGNDSYLVDNIGDRIIETTSGGTDTVTSTISHTLATNVEHLVLAPGTTAINGTGNAADNTLTGNAAANVLTGGDGIDTLRGEAGNDTLRGDANSDRLDGGHGADVMIGGADDDTYVVDNVGDRVSEAADPAAGEDTVESSITHTLATNVENLTLTGNLAINGTGNAAANTLTGNDKANILNGGAEADTMAGGDDNDTYIVDDDDDEVVEDADEGEADTVQSSVAHTLGDNVENLTLTGTAEIDGLGNDLGNALTGNSAGNTLNGYGGIDTLRGNAGNDTLNGGAGADAMTGGTGDDTYTVDDAGDTVTEVTGGGSDTVKSSIAYTLGADVENLTLTGTGDINGTGNASANTITGNTGNNTFAGGGGNDTFVFALGFGQDTISGWEDGDKISLNADLGVADFAALDDALPAGLDDGDTDVAVGADSTTITFDGGDILIVDATDLASDDFLFV